MVQPVKHPPGAPLHLGGDAWAAPDLEPLLVPIEDTHPYPGNPRRHDQDNITASIRDLGLYAGIVTQASSGHTLVGNGRRQALLDLGATRIPRTVMDVSGERAAAIVARDNQTSDASTNDDAELLALLQGSEDTLSLSGYDDADLARLLSLVDLPRDFSGQVDPETELRDAGINDFDNPGIAPAFQAKVNFLTIADYDRFRELLGLTGPRRPRLWFPEQPDMVESAEELVSAPDA